MQNDLRRWLNAVSTLFEAVVQETMDDDDDGDHGSFGWWIFPDGRVEEIEEAGNHGWVADQWLTANMSIPEMPYEDAIEVLVQHGGVRVATFHGSDAMGIDFPPTLSPAVRRALLRLMAEARGAFADYYVGYDTVERHDYQGMMKVIRDHR